MTGRHKVPIDQFAHNGRYWCVTDSHGHQHAAAFRDGAWRYSSDQPVNREITHYVRSNR